MGTKLLDLETILLRNEQWMKLEEDWKPVDLDEDRTEEDNEPAMTTMLSALDLKKTTFDSAQLLKKVRRKVARQLSDKSIIDYNDFIRNLQNNEANDQQFFFVNGQIISAVSIEEICREIDDIFKSIDRLASATSTLRNRKPDVVQCSISAGDLSFDDTIDQIDEEKIDQCIEEAFEDLSGSFTSVCQNETSQESVTTLVKRFTSLLNSPTIQCGPRRQRQCCSRFQALADFWNNRAFHDRS